MRLWRIGSALFPVWSSEGARLKGGRWNHPGTPAIYAATSYASAALEILVHANIGRMPLGFRYVSIDVPDDAPVDTLSVSDMPGWDAMPPARSRDVGDAWLRGRSALILLVPSTVTQGLDQNAVINPLHPDSGRIKIGEETVVQWDSRLLPPRRAIPSNRPTDASNARRPAGTRLVSLPAMRRDPLATSGTYRSPVGATGISP